jgi:hypothetical protein
MGLLAWVALSYLGLLMLASLLAGALCSVAKLSARHGRSSRGEVVLWGRVPPLAKARRHPESGCGAADVVTLRQSAP